MALADLRALAAVRVAPRGNRGNAAGTGNTSDHQKRDENRESAGGAVRVAPVAPCDSARGNTSDTQKPHETLGFPGRVARVAPVAPENGNVGRDEAAALLCGIAEALDVLADRDAIAAEEPGRVAPPSTPPADLVERLAAAMAAPRPWQRVAGDPAPALAYFQGQARRRLAPLDGLARGLLVQAEEAEARRWGALAVHARGTGR